jgi:hypothetical protein
MILFSLFFVLYCMDSSGIRFYVANQLPQYDIGYLAFGTDTSSKFYGRFVLS